MAVYRNIADSHLADARSFGARGDGVHDDTSAIQAAIDATNSVFLPTGVYAIDPAVGIAVKSGTMIAGAGSRESVLLALSGVGSDPVWNASIIRRDFDEGQVNARVDGVTLRDFGVVLTHPATAADTNYRQIAVNLLHISRSRVSNLYIGNYAEGIVPGRTDGNAIDMVQGYGVLFGTKGSGATDYAGGEVNIIRDCAIFGTRKAVSIDDVSYVGANSGAHATLVDGNDIQFTESAWSQESQYAAFCVARNNVVQNVRRARGSTSTTYCYYANGLNHTIEPAYIETDIATTDWLLYFGATSVGIHARNFWPSGLNSHDGGTNNVIEV